MTNPVDVDQAPTQDRDPVALRDLALAEAAGPQGNRYQGPPTPARIKKLEEIKICAANLFYDEGYAATDVRRIAEAVDMHPSTLYNYISSKEGLLYLIMKDGLKAIASGLDTALASSDEPAEQLRAALEAHLTHHMERRHLAWVGHTELRSLSGEFLEDIRSMRHEYEMKWIELLERGMKKRKFARNDPRITTYGLLSIGQTLSRWYEPKGPVSADDICKTLVNVSLSGVLKRP